MFDSGLGKSLLTVWAHLATDPGASELRTREAVVTALQVHSALFATADRPEGYVLCRIAEETRSIPATPESFADAGHWLTAFYLAVVCRNAERLTALCHVPTSKLRESGAVCDEYLYTWIEALQAFWLGRPEFADKLVEAASGTAPGVPSVTGQDYVSQLMWPPMDLLRRRATGQRAEFNSALEQALRAHRAYWSADQERSDSCFGWVALAPLAMACLAADAGFPIEIESDYLPLHLLKGTWADEFPT
ncbi:immunity 49 family protein [Streptomyces sp. NPDC057521]|uniref:immunity 49 family protein n=1 Tax=Streptomyces sp. NPDC057521 TaxID=3346156 RepID=UPI00367AB7AE